jgi:putative N6-adenine-specific DNA methylase
MCGSGTLLCEALMAYSRIPAQVFRTQFGFERLPDFNAVLWEQIKKECRDNFRELKANMISGSDVSDHSVNAARTNIMGLHFGSEITVELKDFREIEAIKNSVIVTNPPYGIRMGKDQNLNQFYKDLGLFFKSRCRQSTAFVYFGEPKYIKKVPLSPAWKRPLEIGGLDGKLVKYDLY